MRAVASTTTANDVRCRWLVPMLIHTTYAAATNSYNRNKNENNNNLCTSLHTTHAITVRFLLILRHGSRLCFCSMSNKRFCIIYFFPFVSALAFPFIIIIIVVFWLRLHLSAEFLSFCFCFVFTQSSGHLTVQKTQTYNMWRATERKRDCCSVLVVVVVVARSAGVAEHNVECDQEPKNIPNCVCTLHTVWCGCATCGTDERKKLCAVNFVILFIQFFAPCDTCRHIRSVVCAESQPQHLEHIKLYYYCTGYITCMQKKARKRRSKQ